MSKLLIAFVLALGVLICSPAFSLDVPPNTKTVQKGRVNRLTVTGRGIGVVEVGLDPVAGKIWRDRIEIRWGKNFIKNGKPLTNMGNINVDDEVAIVTDTTNTKVSKASKNNPANPTLVESISSVAVVTIYLGSDARAMSAEGAAPAAAPAPASKPAGKTTGK